MDGKESYWQRTIIRGTDKLETFVVMVTCKGHHVFLFSILADISCKAFDTICPTRRILERQILFGKCRVLFKCLTSFFCSFTRNVLVVSRFKKIQIFYLQRKQKCSVSHYFALLEQV